MEIDSEIPQTPEAQGRVEDAKARPDYYSDIAQRIEPWMESEGYCKPKKPF